MKQSPGKITITRQSRSNSDDVIVVSMKCADSGVTLQAELSLEAYATASTGLARVECDLIIPNDIAAMGMMKVREPFHFPIAYHDKEEAKRLALELCPDGWYPELYFGSQNSFYYSGSQLYARTSIYQYVEEEEE